VVIAFGIVRVIPGGFDSSSYDVRLSYDGAPIQALVILDTVLAVGTLLALSRRRPFHPRAAIAGATTGAIVLLGAFVVFASLPAVGEAWLQRWLSTRQAPLGAASNLITPASLYCPARVPDNPSDDLSFGSDVPSVYYWINPFAPRWLPDGFGLALDRSSPHPSPHGVWTDERCSEVMLVVDWRTKLIKKWSATGERVGGWTLLPPEWCGDPAWGCREYQARGTTDGGGDPVLIVLRTAGLSSDEADRIALSIPLRDVAYI
jgi:hypothetical protein